MTEKLLILIASLCLADTAKLPSEADVRRRGVAALPEILAHVDAKDPDLRVRARHLARLVARDRWRRDTPKGMKLVLGRIVVDRKGVRSVGGLYLGAREVTLGEFRKFAAKHRRDASRWRAGDAMLPVTNVSLREARAFAKAARARLPTQEELALAAFGGSRRFPWGDRPDPELANTRDAGRGRLLPVGSCKRGASPDGVEDLIGNAAEWTTSDAGRGRFSIVGGSYRTSLRAIHTRGFQTERLPDTARLAHVGFRLARSLPTLGAR